MRNTMRRRGWPVHLLALAALALFVAILYFPLLFTNRVLATGDILLYFYPYREAATTALREGRIPFWNPYLFGGAPLLANPQAAVLYPLHWPLISLAPAKQVVWSAAIHTWLLGAGGYWLLRRWGANGWPGLAPGLTTGLVLSGAGLIGGLLGHLNQLNVAAWAPWAVICVEGARVQASRKRGGFPEAAGFPEASLPARIIALAAVVALMLLAGHTQTAYIVLFGLGVWSLWPLAEVLGGWIAARRASQQSHDRKGVDGSLTLPALTETLTETLARLAVYAGGVAIGALLAAPQLLPTLELSGLGIRTGGLSFQDATSFSLKPLSLLWTLLPTYGLLSLEGIFDTPAYTEYVAYVGVLGLGLALLGGWKGRGRGRAFGLLFVVLGLLLGLGRWNPLYFILHLAVPGFDLFRVPARWMLLYMLGAAVLAGLGMQWLSGWLSRWLAAHNARREHGHVGVPAAPHLGMRATQEGGVSPSHLVTSSPPHRKRSDTRSPAHPLLLLLLAADLLLAGRALPYAHPTAPEAVDGLRSAPAYLLTDPARAATPDLAGPTVEPAISPAAGGRFLGLSTITYDPGDMADYRRIMLESTPPQLDGRAFDDLVIAQKVQELLVPNLPLLWRIPTFDGFDGGVLPLQRYNQFAQLLIAPEQLAPDGRLREQLQEIPPTALLNLMNVQYLITDKVRDLWFEDVYYDRQIGATVDAAHPQTTVTLDGAGGLAAGFEATHLDLIAAAEAPADVWADLAAAALPIAVAEILGADGLSRTLPITAGGAAGAMLADGLLDSPLAQASGAVVAWRDTEGGRQEYRVRLPFDAPLVPEAITLRLLDDRFRVRVQAATLYDARTGMFVALLPSDRGRFARVHSGDVKIYANLDVAPRAYLVTETLSADSPEQAADLLQTQLAGGGAPITVVEGLPPLGGGAAGGDGGAGMRSGDESLAGTAGVVPPDLMPLQGGATAGEAEIVRYAPEEVVVRTHSDAPGLLVLSDAFYPGWRATVDGEAAPIYPANVLFRGVPVPAGEHTVVFTYAPTGWPLGWGLAALGGVLLAALGVFSLWGFRRGRSRAV